LAYPATILQRYDTQTPEKTMQTAQAVCEPGIQQQYLKGKLLAIITLLDLLAFLLCLLFFLLFLLALPLRFLFRRLTLVTFTLLAVF